MASKQRLSRQALSVLAVLARDPSARHYGLEVAREVGLKSGSIYPILARFEDDELVSSAWEEDVDPSEVGRPARRYYQITGAGQRLARAEAAEARRLLDLDAWWKPGASPA